MHRCNVVMLLFALLAVGFHSASSFSNEDSDVPYLNRLTRHNTATLTRVLRSHFTADDDDTHANEERTGASVISTWLDKLVYKGLEKMNPSPALLFKTVGLGKESVKLDNNNPTFIRWLQYVKKYRATKDDEFAFVDNQLIKLLNGKLSESELVTLSVSLTKVSGLEDLSSSLIRSLAWMESRHKLFNEAWLKAKESPDKVFKILELEGRVQARDPMFREWLRYSDMYMKETGRSFPVANFLAKPETDHRIAVIFQSLKEVDDLKALAETQQTNLFKNWIKEFTYTPRTLQRTLSAPLIRGGPMFATLEAYTLQFAKHKGSKVLEEVKTLFAADDFMGALLAAEKL